MEALDAAEAAVERVGKLESGSPIRARLVATKADAEAAVERAREQVQELLAPQPPRKRPRHIDKKNKKDDEKDEGEPTDAVAAAAVVSKARASSSSPAQSGKTGNPPRH